MGRWDSIHVDSQRIKWHSWENVFSYTSNAICIWGTSWRPLPKCYWIVEWCEGLGIFGKEITSSLSKASRFWLFLRGITLWTTRIERIVLTSVRLGGMNIKCKALFGRTILTMRELLGRKCLKTLRMSLPMMMCLLSLTFGGGGKGGELVYHRSNDKIMWHIRTPKVGLINHA